MSTGPSVPVRRPRTACAICGSVDLEVAIDLPGLPLTALYSREAPGAAVPGIDQQLLVCMGCGHGELGYPVGPEVLYDETYSFRTSASEKARRGTRMFLAMLDELAPGRRFRCAVDLGCNDLYLLRQLEGRATARVGIDPVLSARDDGVLREGIVAVGALVEDVDLRLVLDSAPDLIVCRHTLEHIHEPRAVLQKLYDVAANDALFLFEVPGFDSLVQRLRFDQVFHQHAHYFSLGSFRRLVEELGGTYRGWRENYHDWGAIVVAFAKRNGQPKRGHIAPPLIDIARIGQRYGVFRRQLAAANEVLMSLAGPVYGYGAAQMLPVLAYHLGNDLSSLLAVLDDDPGKDGLRYWNLPVAIRRADLVADLHEASVVITAVDNVEPILPKLLARRPRHIVYPLGII